MDRATNTSKVIKISTDLENQQLKEKLEVYQELVSYVTLETVSRQKDRIRELEDENLKLKTVDIEKDKLIKFKDDYIKGMNNQFKAREIQLQKNYEADKEATIRKLKNNIDYTKIKPLQKEKDTVVEERDRMKEMYDAMLENFNRVHESNSTILDIAKEILAIVKQELKEKKPIESIIKTIEEKEKALEGQRILTDEEICDTIYNWLSNGYTQKALAKHLFPNITRAEQKISEYKKSEYYQNKYVNKVL